MAGIAGAAGYIDVRIADAVRRMNAALAHRGQDGSGTWRSGGPETPGHGVILGAGRNAILDLTARSKQPMVDEEHGAAIVLDGEVFNYRDLREEMESDATVFCSAGDTEVVLKAFVRWGPAFLERIEGMFALAVWSPHKPRLLLARDRLGHKPLYWGRYVHPSGDRTVLFASEIRALLATELFPRRVDPEGLSTYIWNGFLVSPLTIVRGIRCVRAGTFMEIDAENVEASERRYWQLADFRDESRDAGDIQEALRRAVGRQLQSDAPLGLFLSGGIDSSAVAAVACGLSGQRLSTFNVAFDDEGFDESPFARAVAEALGTDHHEIRISESHFRENLELALSSLDQPSFDALNTFVVSRAVRDAGVRVALGGTGGDDLFGGNRTFLDIPMTVRWGKALSPVPEHLLRLLSGVVTRWKTGPKGTIPYQTRWGKLGDVLAARGDLVKLYQLSYGLFTSRFAGQLALEPACYETRFGIPRARFTELRSACDHIPLMYAIALLELSLFVGERLLRDIDSASMSVGLEVRSPLLDDGLIEAWRRADPEVVFSPLGKKQVLVNTALSRLDRKLFERPKTGFVLPLERWCRKGLADTLAGTFSDAEHCEAVGINPAAAWKLWAAFEKADSGVYWSRVWALFVYLWWTKREGVVW